MTNPSKEDDIPAKFGQTGQCYCGACKFHVEGVELFNMLCHCRACGRARGMTPVHLIGVSGEFTFLEGEENAKTIKGLGTVMHTNCKNCGGGLYQRPEGARFYAVFPTSFQIESTTEVESPTSVPSCLLPPHLLPKCHANYENRLHNYYDSLPKFKAFAGGNAVLMTNEGDIIVE